ncbi:MAG: glycosyltransferase family 2 protein [Planctomycetota bacterium]|jgi:GT2 family glycosyltransferase
MDGTTPELSIVVVSYNTADLTIECLKSVREQTTRVSYEVIVVDNNSTDGSADRIASEHPWVALIRSSENLGFAGGNNEGVSRARGEHVLLLNPDTLVLDHAIDMLYEYAKKNPDAGIWGGRTLFEDRSLNPSSCWRRQTVWNLFCRACGLTGLFRGSGVLNAESYGGWNRDSEREVDIVSGCFFLTTRSLWDEVGGFDEAFFMYGEEADLCLRARKKGVRPRVTPHATIIHYGGASERVKGEKLVRLFSAKVGLLRRHWHPKLVWFGVWMHLIWSLTRMTAFRVLAKIQASRWGHNHEAWSMVWSRRKEWMNAQKPDPPAEPPLSNGVHHEGHAA